MARRERKRIPIAENRARGENECARSARSTLADCHAENRAAAAASPRSTAPSCILSKSLIRQAEASREILPAGEQVRKAAGEMGEWGGGEESDGRRESSTRHNPIAVVGLELRAKKVAVKRSRKNHVRFVVSSRGLASRAQTPTETRVWTDSRRVSEPTELLRVLARPPSTRQKGGQGSGSHSRVDRSERGIEHQRRRTLDARRDTGTATVAQCVRWTGRRSHRIDRPARRLLPSLA